MRRRWLSTMLGLVAGAGAALALLAWLGLLHGCAPLPVSPAESAPACIADAVKLESESATCTEAQLKVDVMFRYSASCRALFGDGGINVCARLDGGHHD